MKKISNVLLFIFIMIINLFFIISFISSKKESFSEEENRYLSKFNIKNIEEYINDYFPFRTKLIGIKNRIEYLSGKELINGIYVGKDDYLISDFIDIEKKKKDYIIDSINDFNSINGNVDVMIVPDSIYYNSDKIDNIREVDKEDEEISYLYSKLNTNNIDLRKENITFYKSDHHWTTDGAFEAYKAYFNSKNKYYYDINRFYRKKVSSSFLGTSSSLVLGLAKEDDMYIYDIDNNIEVSYVYEKKTSDSLYNFDYLDKKDKYAMFLDNNHALIEITNKDLNDESSIVIIKNSYANSFIPFIVNHYNKVYVIDLRYFNENVSDFIIKNNIKDKLILYNLNNLYSDLSIVRLK